MEQSAHIRRAAEPQRLHGRWSAERDWCWARTDLDGQQLTPFVSREVRPAKGDYKGLDKGPQDPYFYVEQWKRFNGID